jgi:cytochrome c-type protein NapB
MKNIIIGASLILGIVITANAGINENGCKACHGQNWEKSALGKSKIVADMNQTQITESLLGYKNGTYGGTMAGVMKGQVIRYSDEDIKNFKIKLKETISK